MGKSIVVGARQGRAISAAGFALVAMLFVAGCGSDGSTPVATAATPAAGFETVSIAQIAPRVQAGEVLLVDVREDDEWAAGHAPTAVHVPLATVGDRLSEITEAADGRPVAFICRSGNRSAQASRVASDGGVRSVINVSGGMDAWGQAGLPVETPVAQNPA